MVKNSRPVLDQVLPDGLLVDRKWLDEKGFKRSAVDYYLRSGTLVAVAHGVYRRPGPPLKWQHVVYSLQILGYGVHIGGRTAMELQGMAHYLPVRGMQHIWLYGAKKLPAWVNKLDMDCRFALGKSHLFMQLPESGLATLPFGHWDWPLCCARPELALLEILAGVKTSDDFEAVDKLFESATTLRPNVLMKVLMACSQVKAKRLFLWLAERHSHAWFHKLDTETIQLGSGKRMLVKGGRLVPKYQITVPAEMIDGPE